MPLNRLISACSKPSSRGPSAHGLDPWGKPGPAFPSDERLKGGSRLSPGRRLYAHFDARLLCFVLLLLLRSAARGRTLCGYLAAGGPGPGVGLDNALTRYGKLGRAAVMAPAIALARDGFALGEADAAIIAARAERLGKDPEAARIFLRPDGGPHPAGDRLVQPDLAKTLALIAEGGPDAFYRGPIAAAVAAASAAQGGIFTKEDFAAYTATEMPPIPCTYRGHGILSAPPPSAGGTILCEMLNVLAGWDLGASGAASAQTIQLMAETMRHAYVDRNSFLGDPAFVTNPLDRLQSQEHAAAIRAAIDPDKATGSAALR